jgi:glutaconate CoA-transferase, subunit A
LAAARPSGGKRAALRDAVREHVHDGDCVFVGGFGQCIPFAIAHEIIRQERRRLVLCRSGADIAFDVLIAAGCVAKVVVGYIGNPGLGLANAFRRAAEAGEIEVEDWTNFAMVLRLHAGSMGVPFLPTATLRGGDIGRRLDLQTVACPYTSEELVAIPALRPDVAIVHAARGDEDGNLQLGGLTGDTVEGAMASERIIATVEEIVPANVIRAAPERTIIPGFRVSAICAEPWGAYPSYVDGSYGRDDEAYAEWDRLSRDPDRLQAWIDAEIRGVADFASYIDRLDSQRLRALRDAMARGTGSA